MAIKDQKSLSYEEGIFLIHILSEKNSLVRFLPYFYGLFISEHQEYFSLNKMKLF